MGCQHGHKIYTDISNQWYITIPYCEGLDTSNGVLKPIFSSYKTVSPAFILEKSSDDNTIYKVECYYTENSNGVQGDYFRVREAKINRLNDSISFTLFTNILGDSLGTFTGKYNKQNDRIDGYFDTFYSMYCFCRFAGMKAPYKHKVSATY